MASTIQETADLKTYSSIVNSKELKGVVQQDQRSVRSANIASVVKKVVEEGAGTSWFPVSPRPEEDDKVLSGKVMEVIKEKPSVYTRKGYGWQAKTCHCQDDFVKLKQSCRESDSVEGN